MTERFENNRSNYYQFDSVEESPAHSQAYSELSDRSYSNKWDTRKEDPQSINFGRLDYGAYSGGAQSADFSKDTYNKDFQYPYPTDPIMVPIRNRDTLGVNDYGYSDYGGYRSRNGNENALDYRNSAGARSENAYPFTREFQEDLQARHDRELRQLIEQVQNGDDAKFAKRVKDAGGRQPEINVPEPTAEQREKANQNLDRQNNETRENRKSSGDKVTDQQYQDASKLQKAILSGDVNAVQSVMDTYKNDSEGLRKVINEAAGLVSGNAILHYDEGSDGSMKLSVNTEPTREQSIQPIVSFSNDGKTRPSVSGHATTSSLSPGAQHHVNGSLPGDPTVEKALKNIGDAAVLVLAARRP